MKRCILAAHENGTKYMAFLEGTWKQHFDLFEEIPKGALIAILESDDIIDFKKRFGDQITVAGGMPLAMLKHETEKACIDQVKRVYDACAPGGGFIFTVDKPPLGPKDLNVDNLKAVNAFAHEYGRY